MRFRRSRGNGEEERRWSRRLVDLETREFIENFLEETRDVYRRAAGDFDLRGLTRDAFASAPTTDLRWLRERGGSADDFYDRELAPSWDGLEQAQRAEKIEQFVRLSNSLGAAYAEGYPPDEPLLDMIAAVHTKVLLLAWAFDRTYGFMDRIIGNPAQFGAHGDGPPAAATARGPTHPAK